MPRAGARAGATGDAGGAAGGKERITEAQTNNCERPANGPAPRRLLISESRLLIPAAFIRGKKTSVSQQSRRSRNFKFSVAAVSAGSPPVVRRLFEVNSEPHTGACPSVRLCVGLKILSGISFTRISKVCLSVRPPVRPFVRPSVHPAAHPSVRPSVRPSMWSASREPASRTNS